MDMTGAANACAATIARNRRNASIAGRFHRGDADRSLNLASGLAIRFNERNFRHRL
jgi:hypothetical protein